MWLLLLTVMLLCHGSNTVGHAAAHAVAFAVVLFRLFNSSTGRAAHLRPRNEQHGVNWFAAADFAGRAVAVPDATHPRFCSGLNAETAFVNPTDAIAAATDTDAIGKRHAAA